MKKADPDGFYVLLGMVAVETDGPGVRGKYLELPIGQGPRI